MKAGVRGHDTWYLLQDCKQLSWRGGTHTHGIGEDFNLTMGAEKYRVTMSTRMCRKIEGFGILKQQWALTSLEGRISNRMSILCFQFQEYNV